MRSATILVVVTMTALLNPTTPTDPHCIIAPFSKPTSR